MVDINVKTDVAISRKYTIELSEEDIIKIIIDRLRADDYLPDTVVNVDIECSNGAICQGAHITWMDAVEHIEETK